MFKIHQLAPTIPLLVGLALFAPPSEASPPAPRQQTDTKAANRTPPPRKVIKLSPEVQQRLSRATVTRKARSYVPLTKQDVRARISADQRPARATAKAKPKRVSNTELTNELNAVERKLNSQGYTLRDNQTVTYHEHQPDHATLEQQVRRIKKVTQTKPARAPSTAKQLRSKVRRTAKPPARRRVGTGANTNGFYAQQDSGSAAADFGWTPSVGEPAIGSAFLDTRASFSGSIGGMDPGLHGSVVVRAGAYVFNQRVDALRVDATLTGTLDGAYEADVTAMLGGVWEVPLYNKKSTKSIDDTDSRDLFDFDRTFHTQLYIVGYPVDLDLTVHPTLSVAFDLALSDGILIGSLRPEVRVEATLEAYFNALVAKAGAGGSVVLLAANPELTGTAYLVNEDGQTAVHASVEGWIRCRFLEGRLYAVLDLGVGWFSKRFEHELIDYAGWAVEYPFVEWDSSTSP
ncbi:hypothetical protein DB30_07997 [Enhygromyxa salina]|uniref:Uncharacterized protein n=1 Tax=Enhygromyxa salina TaxID=215803 RepID=A0A0C2CV72_9BACT|nr:hypothetical protein [Enhygromyxa salina]KIG13485.1 hypothetical protein DB30_07997 [Enhygromyxa salina]